MREIRFRGFSEQQNKWIYGSYIKASNGKEEIHAILEIGKSIDCITEVIKESVGQFTGLKDKNGKEIFENDILNFGNNNNVLVVFDNGSFNVFDEPLGWDFDTENEPVKTDFIYCEIIENLHENPELLTNK